MHNTPSPLNLLPPPKKLLLYFTLFTAFLAGLKYLEFIPEIGQEIDWFSPVLSYWFVYKEMLVAKGDGIFCAPDDIRSLGQSAQGRTLEQQYLCSITGTKLYWGFYLRNQNLDHHLWWLGFESKFLPVTARFVLCQDISSCDRNFLPVTKNCFKRQEISSSGT